MEMKYDNDADAEAMSLPVATCEKHNYTTYSTAEVYSWDREIHTAKRPKQQSSATSVPSSPKYSALRPSV